MTVANPVRGTVLVADSRLGVVWSVSVCIGNVSVAINDTSMAPLTREQGGLPLSFNGILDRGDGYLCYDNTDQSTFNRISLDLVAGHATGIAQTIVKSNHCQTFPDDSTVDFAGNAWMPTALGGHQFHSTCYQSASATPSWYDGWQFLSCSRQ